MLGALTVSPLLLTTEKRPVRSTTPVVKQGTNSPKTRRACMHSATAYRISAHIELHDPFMAFQELLQTLFCKTFFCFLVE